MEHYLHVSAPENKHVHSGLCTKHNMEKNIARVKIGRIHITAMVC